MTDEKQYSDEEMLAYLRVYTDIWGVPPRVDDITELPGPHGTLYNKRFESYEAALREAGVHPEAEGGR
jgi:hypothetical protein